jgi:hypothetical protein
MKRVEEIKNARVLWLDYCIAVLSKSGGWTSVAIFCRHRGGARFVSFRRESSAVSFALRTDQKLEKEYCQRLRIKRIAHDLLHEL